MEGPAEVKEADLGGQAEQAGGREEAKPASSTPAMADLTDPLAPFRPVGRDGSDTGDAGQRQGTGSAKGRTVEQVVPG